MPNLNLFLNIINNFNFLKSDFVGIKFSFLGILLYFENLFLATFIILIFYLLGERIRLFFFKDKNSLTEKYFINIAVGYIFIGSLIALIGVFSVLYPIVIALFLTMICLIAFYPFFNLGSRVGRVLASSREILTGNHKWVIIGIFIFVFMMFLRLIPPEIGEDMYHTDLPRLYITNHSLILESKEPQHVIPYSQLAEMSYLIPVFLGHKDVARYIHFGFYALIILLILHMTKNKKYTFSIYAPLLFVTAPVVIRYASSAYVDFQWLFCWLVSIFIIQSEKISTKRSAISGIIFGGVLATKLWTLVYFPVMILFIFFVNKNLEKKIIAKSILIFSSFALFISVPWYIRDYEITGNPIFPFFSEQTGLAHWASSYLGFNFFILSIPNIIVFSPLFFLAIGLNLSKIKSLWTMIGRLGFLTFFVLLSIEHFFIKIYLGRHLLGWYTIASIVVSAGINNFTKNLIGKYLFAGLFVLLFVYYFLNTLFILPYGFDWSDKNKYLTRILSRDNSSYYDFDHQFDKWISNKDLVATFDISGFYYANFSYIDTNYIFDKKNNSFDLLRKRGVTRLFIKGGDFNWFCRIVVLINCGEKDVRLLASYPPETRKYNLYKVN